jgi:type I restriction enzyme S subunit
MSNQNEHKPGYKHTPLGWLPEDWEAVKLKSICSVNQGLQIPIEDRLKEQVDGAKVYITIQYLNNGKDAEFIKAASKSVCCDEDDILMTRTGNTGIVVTGVHGVFHNNFFKINYDKQRINKTYLIEYLNEHKTQHTILVKAGTSTIPDLNHKDFYSIYFPLPSLLEQCKIAAILSTWDEAITKTQQLIAQLQQRNKGLMQQLLTAKHDWKEYRLGDLLKEVKRPVAWNDEELYHLISVRRRSGGAFFRESLYGKQILTKQLFTAEAGDFLISKMQIVHGASAVVPPEFDGMKISGSYIAVHAKDDDVMDINFFNWLSKTKWFYRLTYISSYGVHIEKMTFDFDDFKRRKIMLPPSIGEQKSIVTVLQTAADEVKLYEHKLAVLQLQKKGLMQKLLTGQVRVKIK